MFLKQLTEQYKQTHFYLILIGIMFVGFLGGCGNNDNNQQSVFTGASHGLILVGSDFLSGSTLSLIDPVTHTFTAENFLNSGSQIPGLSVALSSDLTLSSHQRQDSDIVVIDRANSNITFIDPKTTTVLRQFSVGQANYGVNPSDYLELSPQKAYVARFGVVLEDGSGDDVLIINPQTGAQIGRISMTPATTDVNDPEAIYGRPIQLIPVDDYVYVILQNLSLGFAGGQLSIAIIDPKQDKIVTTVNLDDFKNCSGGSLEPKNDFLIISCRGGYSDASQAASSAVVVLDLANPTNPLLLQAVMATTIAQGHLITGDAQWLAADRAIVITNNYNVVEMTGGDQIVTIDFSTVPPSMTFVLEENLPSYTVSTFVDTTNQQLFILKGNPADPVIEIFPLQADGNIAAAKEVLIPAANTLPPRSLAGF